MTTGSIQNTGTNLDARLAAWHHVAIAHGVDFGPSERETAATLDDRQLARRLFAQLGDVEHDEILWAIGGLTAGAGAIANCADAA